MAGRIAVFVKLRGESVAASPIFIDVTAGPASASHCTLVGRSTPSTWCVRVGEACSFTLQIADAFGNPRPRSADRLVIQTSGAAGFTFDVEPLDDGRYLCSGTPVVAGQYYVTPMLNGIECPPCLLAVRATFDHRLGSRRGIRSVLVECMRRVAPTLG